MHIPTVYSSIHLFIYLSIQSIRLFGPCLTYLLNNASHPVLFLLFLVVLVFLVFLVFLVLLVLCIQLLPN